MYPSMLASNVDWNLTVLCGCRVTYGGDFMGRRNGWGFDVHVTVDPANGLHWANQGGGEGGMDKNEGGSEGDGAAGGKGGRKTLDYSTLRGLRFKVEIVGETKPDVLVVGNGSKSESIKDWHPVDAVSYPVWTKNVCTFKARIWAVSRKHASECWWLKAHTHTHIHEHKLTHTHTQ